MTQLTPRPLKINTNQYVLAGSETSAAITLVADDIASNVKSRFVDITNTSTYDMYVVSGISDATATKPTSATAPVVGAVVPAGGRATFTLIDSHAKIAAIWDGGAAGKGIFKVGQGI